VSLIVLEEVGLDFGDRTLFDGVSLRVAEGDRIGLIGPNGSGKSTLLKMIAGGQEADRGVVRSARGVEVGYLSQDLVVDEAQTLGALVIESIPGRAGISEHLAKAEEELARLAESDAYDKIAEVGERVAELHVKLDNFERLYSEHVALKILHGLGFEPGDEKRALGEFSGGWRVRGALAAILFRRPDVMLLDEPTNHLDLPSVSWFSSFLAQNRQAFLLISHDREFLNEQIKRVVSIEPEGVRSYSGDYEWYVKQRKLEEEILEAQAKNQAKERADIEKFIERFRYKASKAAAVQSRVKKLAKMKEVERYQHRRTLKFSFPPAEKAPGEVLRIEQLAKSFDDHHVFSGLDMTVRRGEKIALIGPNGAGKTTLLRIIARELKASKGSVRAGNGVKIGYYAQHHADTLHAESTVYQEVQRVSPDTAPGRIRSVLGAFMFSGDDVDKSVSVLSGGERARLALARLLVLPGNLLLMDEPTNHLDLWSSESLADALSDYDGTLVFVSHNRALVRQLATRIWNVAGGTVETYPGTLDEYIYSCQQRDEEPSAAVVAHANETATEESGRSRKDQRDRKRREAEARQKRSKKVAPLEKKVKRLEESISELEKAQAGRSTVLSDPAVYEDKDQRNQLLNEFQAAGAKLDQLTADWEESQEALERALAELSALDEN